MADVLAVIADLRAFDSEAHELGSPAARLAEGPRTDLEANANGVTLELALGVATPRGGRTSRQERTHQARAAIDCLRTLVPAGQGLGADANEWMKLRQTTI